MLRATCRCLSFCNGKPTSVSFATQRRHIEADKKLHARRGAPTPSCHASASSNHEVLCHPHVDTDDSGDEAGLDAPRGGMEANLDDPNLDDPRDVGLEAFEHQFGDYMLDNIDDRFHKNWRSRQRPRFDLPDDVTRLLRVINRTKASRQETNDLLDSLGDVLEARSSLLIPTRKRSLSTYLRSIEDNESKVIREEITHVCKNGCVLFRGKHADANVCPICHTSRWVQCRIANEHRQPAAVVYYYPVQDSIRRLYSEEENEALEQKVDGITGITRSPPPPLAPLALIDGETWYLSDVGASCDSVCGSFPEVNISAVRAFGSAPEAVLELRRRSLADGCAQEQQVWRAVRVREWGEPRGCAGDEACAREHHHATTTPPPHHHPSRGRGWLLLDRLVLDGCAHRASVSG